MRKILTNISILILLIAHLGFAGPIDDLKNSPSRPTILELKQKLNPWPKNNPFEGGDERVALVHDTGASVIAQMEFAFPGATWAPLGRDAVLVGDILDAFYQSLGQFGRVRRLEASGTSLAGVSGTEDVLARFLESNGANLSNPESSSPFIIFDYTSYGHLSQSTRLIRAGYNRYRMRRANAADLVTKFNLLTLGRGMTHQIVPGFNPTQFLNSLKPGLAAGNDVPAYIMDVVGGNVFTYGLEWHSSFGQLIQLPDGRLAGPPGALSTEQARLSILSSLYEIVGIVSKPGFLKKVKSEAKKLGYDFSAQQDSSSQNFVPKPPDPKEIMETYERSLVEMIEEFKKPEEKNAYYSANAKKLFDWLKLATQDELKNDVTLMFIRHIIKAKEEEKLRNRDFRRLLARAFGIAEPTEAFAKEFEKLYLGSELISEVLNEKAGVFLESKEKDAERVANMYRFLEDSARCSSQLVFRNL